MNEELTPWFPPKVKPARPGVYLATVHKNEAYFRYWTGWHWLVGGDTPSEAAEAARGGPVSTSPMHWRGLAEQPK